MQVICASNNGVIKVCAFEELDHQGFSCKKRLLHTWGQPNKEHEIDALEWLNSNHDSKISEQSSTVVVALKNSEVRIMDLNTGQITKTFKDTTQRIKGLTVLNKNGNK
jgi:hypothetical protein